MAICTALGHAKLHSDVPCFKLLQMVSKEVASTADMVAGGLPHFPYVGRTDGIFEYGQSFKSGQSVFLVKCMEQDMHVGSFLIGCITHPGHDERHPTEAQTAMRAQLIHNLLTGRITREETLYLHKEDLDAVFLKHGRTVI